MSYQPVVPLGGIAGWRYLERTAETQRAAYAASPVEARDIEYFKAHIAEADTPEKLVGDYRLLKVALGAFGLGPEIDKKAFIRKVLEEGTEEKGAFATRLVDPRYRDIAKAFGYGDAKGAQVAGSGFAEDVVERYRIQSFEEAVGAVDEDMRFALNFQRQVSAMAAEGTKSDLNWTRVLGDKALRQVFQTAFGLPSQTAALDIDRQLGIFKDKAREAFGTSDFSALSDPEARDNLLRRFFARRQIENGPSATTPGMAALSLLQNASSFMASQNLFLSRL